MTTQKDYRCGITDSKLTKCLVCKDKEEQRNCLHYSKSSHEKRCMFLTFGEYCDWCEGIGK